MCVFAIFHVRLFSVHMSQKIVSGRQVRGSDF